MKYDNPDALSKDLNRTYFVYVHVRRRDTRYFRAVQRVP